VVVAQSAEGPLAYLEQYVGDRLRGVGRQLEQKVVAVAENRRISEGAQPVERLRGLRAALGDVAQADRGVDADAVDVCHGRRERDVVAVHVGDESDPHLPGRFRSTSEAPAPASARKCTVANAASGR
jgi:hypothetical protein